MLQKGLRNNIGKSHFIAFFYENNRKKNLEIANTDPIQPLAGGFAQIDRGALRTGDKSGHFSGYSATFFSKTGGLTCPG
jgi:hypothetical protein